MTTNTNSRDPLTAALTAGGPTVAQRHRAAMEHLRGLNAGRLP